MIIANAKNARNFLFEFSANRNNTAARPIIPPLENVNTTAKIEIIITAQLWIVFCNDIWTNFAERLRKLTT